MSRPDYLGPLPPGAKSLTLNLGALASANYLESPDSSTFLIARFAVAARPVPWKVSIRRGAPNAKLMAWQREVALAARVAMNGRKPYAGPVVLNLSFRLRRFGRMPDRTNLLKSTEDAIQGIVIINDNQCKDGRIFMDDDASENEAVVEVLRYTGKESDCDG